MLLAQGFEKLLGKSYRLRYDKGWITIRSTCSKVNWLFLLCHLVNMLEIVLDCRRWYHLKHNYDFTWYIIYHNKKNKCNLECRRLLEIQTSTGIQKVKFPKRQLISGNWKRLSFKCRRLLQSITPSRETTALVCFCLGWRKSLRKLVTFCL